MTITDPDIDQPGHGIGTQPEATPAPLWRQLVDRIPAQWRTRQTGMIAGAAVAIVALGTILGVTLGGSGSPAQASQSYDTLRASDISLNEHWTEKHYFVVWNAAWTISPTIAGGTELEPGTDWLVTYETTAPTAVFFTGETYSFTVHVTDDGEVTYSGNGLNVGVHAITTHPDRIEFTITQVSEK